MTRRALCAVAAAVGVAPAVVSAAAYTYTGTGGTAAAPTTGVFSTGFGGTAPTSATTTELDFGGSGTAAYTATDDLSGAFTLNNLVLSGTATGVTETIANGSGSSLNFGGATSAITQNGAGGFNVTGPITLTTAATFNGSGSGTVTLTGVVSGGSGLTVAAAAATLVLTNTDVYTGATTIAAGGTLSLGNGTNSGSLPTAAGSVLVDNGLLVFNRSTGTVSQGGSLTASGISGTGGVTQLGTGTVNLTAANTYTGQTTIGAGTVILGRATTTGSLSPSSAIVDNGTLGFNRSAGAGAVQGTDFAGVVSGTGGVTQFGLGTLVLNGANTYTGPTVLAAGAVNVAGTEAGTSGPLGAGGTISFTGGTLQYSAADTADYSARFSAAAGQAYSVDTNGQTVTFAAGLTSTTGTLTKLGTGTLVLTGASTYTGSTTVSAGTLQVGSGPTGTLSAGTAVTDNATLAFARTNRITQGVGFGLISGTGVVTQSGVGGTVVLNQANTYTGGTTVTGGTLVANTSSGSSTGTAGVTVTTAGVLAGTGTASGTVLVTSGGEVTAGSGATTSDTIGTLTTGAQTWNAAGGYVAKVASGGASNDQLLMSGLTIAAGTGSPFTVTLTGTGTTASPSTLSTTPVVIATDTATNAGVFTDAITAGSLVLKTSNLTVPSGYTATLTEADSGGSERLQAVLTATPEPTSLALCGGATASLLVRRRRVRRA